MNSFDRLNQSLEKLDDQIRILKNRKQELIMERQNYCSHSNIIPGPGGTHHFSINPDYVCSDCQKQISIVQFHTIQYRRYLVEAGMDDRAVREMDDQELILQLEAAGFFQSQHVQ